MGDGERNELAVAVAGNEKMERLASRPRVAHQQHAAVPEAANERYPLPQKLSGLGWALFLPSGGRLDETDDQCRKPSQEGEPEDLLLEGRVLGGDGHEGIVPPFV